MKVSVITVNYNNKQGLEATIASVKQQNYCLLEYIIIDANSNDGSREVIEQNKGAITYYVSEPDKGIYDGMNKGIAAATGDYVLFLNSGDYFVSSDSVRLLMNEVKEEDFIYGDLIFKDDHKESIFTYPDVLDFDFFIRDSLPHPATLIKRKMFEQFGFYKTTFRICADWVFFLDTIAKNNGTYKHVKVPVSVFLLGGTSSNEALVVKEKEEYLQKEYTFFYISHKRMLKYRHQLAALSKSRLLRAVFKVLPKQYAALIKL